MAESDRDDQGLGFAVTGDATVKRAGPVITGHVVCRGPDGEIKWEADTVPVALDLAAGAGGTPESPVRMDLDPATLRAPGQNEGE